VKVGADGQIVIPRKLRERYGLLPDVEIELVPDTEGIHIKRKACAVRAVKQVYGILKKKNSLTDHYIEDIRGR